jgi:hypothetical protein
LAKAAFCHRREGPKQGISALATAAQKVKCQNEAAPSPSLLKIAQIPMNRATYYGPYSERPEVREGYRRAYQPHVQDRRNRRAIQVFGHRQGLPPWTSDGFQITLSETCGRQLRLFSPCRSSLRSRSVLPAFSFFLPPCLPSSQRTRARPVHHSAI